MIKASTLLAGVALAFSLSACSTFDLGTKPSEALQQEVAALSAPTRWVLGPQTDGKLAQNWSDVVSDSFLHTFI